MFILAFLLDQETYEPPNEKINVDSDQVRHKPSCTSTEDVEAANFGFRKKRNCTIRVATTKTLISFAVTVKLICACVFIYAKCWFSHKVAHIFTRQSVFSCVINMNILLT